MNSSASAERSSSEARNLLFLFSFFVVWLFSALALHTPSLYSLSPMPKRRRRRNKRLRRIFRYVYLKLVRKNDSPERVGRGAGIGIFVGVFPTFYFGPIIAVAVAHVARANRAAALLGDFVCGPLTPITWTVCVLMGNLLVSPERRIAADLIRHRDTTTIAKQFLGTFMIGNVVISTALAILGYFVVWYLAHRYHQRRLARLASRR